MRRARAGEMWSEVARLRHVQRDVAEIAVHRANAALDDADVRLAASIDDRDDAVAGWLAQMQAGQLDPALLEAWQGRIAGTDRCVVERQVSRDGAATALTAERRSRVAADQRLDLTRNRARDATRVARRLKEDRMLSDMSELLLGRREGPR